MSLNMIVLFLALILAVASAGLVGAPEDADMNDPEIQNALQFAIIQYNRQSKDVYIRQVSEVIKVQTQVAAGLNYIFYVKVGRTACRKGKVKTTMCAVHPNPRFANIIQCKIVVWSRLQSIQVTENSCL